MCRAVRTTTHRSTALLCGAILLASLVAGCRTAEAEIDVATIAFLRAVPGTATTQPAMLEQLRELGFVPGRNLRVLAEDPDEAYPDDHAAAEAVRGWVDEGVNLIVALSSGGALVARDTAPGVPILFLSNDPVATGLVVNEDAPEGMLTGLTFRVPADRTLDVARRALGELASVGIAHPSGDPAAEASLDVVLEAAARLGVEVATASFEEAEEIPDAVSELAAAGVDALLLSTSPTATRLIPETDEAAAAHALPLIVNVPLESRAIVALWPDSAEMGRQLGRQAARLLAGSSPGAVPVEDPRRFVLVVNAGRAAELGFDVPAELRREADEVIP